MHAIILAGGFGTRLRSAVSDVPKPLAPINGRPFLAWQIEALARQGVTSITLSVHHKWQTIRDYFDVHSPAIPLHYAVEETPLGTGGGMVHALKVYPQAEPVFILNGDSFIKMDYTKLYAQHQQSGASLTMTLCHVADAGRYGIVKEQGGIITSFAQGVAGQAGLINAGLYVINPNLFAHINETKFSFERDFLPDHLATLKPRSFHADGYFIDIGTPEDYARASSELAAIIETN